MIYTYPHSLNWEAVPYAIKCILGSFPPIVCTVALAKDKFTEQKEEKGKRKYI